MRQKVADASQDYVRKRLNDDRTFIAASLGGLIFITTLFFNNLFLPETVPEKLQSIVLVVKTSGQLLFATFIAGMISLKFGNFFLEDGDRRLYTGYKISHFLTYIFFFGSVTTIASLFFPIDAAVAAVIYLGIVAMTFFIDFYLKPENNTK